MYTPYLTLEEVADPQVWKSLLLHGLRIIQFHLRVDTWVRAEEVQYIVVPTSSECTNPQSGKRVYNSNTVASVKSGESKNEVISRNQMSSDIEHVFISTRKHAKSRINLASFLGCPTVQFLIACSMQKKQHSKRSKTGW